MRMHLILHYDDDGDDDNDQNKRLEYGTLE